MNFGNLMALRPLNDEKFILGNKSYDEIVEIAVLRKGKFFLQSYLDFF